MNCNVSFSLQTSRTALEEALHFGHAQCTKLLMRASSIAKQNVSVKCGSLHGACVYGEGDAIATYHNYCKKYWFDIYYCQIGSRLPN